MFHSQIFTRPVLTQAESRVSGHGLASLCQLHALALHRWGCRTTLCRRMLCFRIWLRKLGMMYQKRLGKALHHEGMQSPVPSLVCEVISRTLQALEAEGVVGDSDPTKVRHVERTCAIACVRVWNSQQAGSPQQISGYSICQKGYRGKDSWAGCQSARTHKFSPFLYCDSSRGPKNGTLAENYP